MSRIILLFILFGSYFQVFSQISDEELLRAIRHDDLLVIEDYFKKNKDTKRLYGDKKVSILHYAASIDKKDVVKIILDKGGNIEQLFGNETPLMTSSFFGCEATVKFLLKKGAKVNFQNNKGKTAAIMTAQNNKPRIIKILLENGADFNLKDKSDNSAIDYAYKMQNIDVYKLLINIPGNKYESKVIPTYFDGPYVFWQGKSKIKVTYLISDSAKNKCFTRDTTINTSKNEIILNTKGQSFEIKLRSDPNFKNPDTYTGVKKIMALGDLHGGFDQLSQFLIENKIIDTNYKWIFGDGHLLVIGDIFDRGNKVTECFWLLYKLESEAVQQNGRVHVILGNHEIMQFSEDKRYLNEKYLDLFNRLKFNYSDFYGTNTELGKWLRSRNVIVKLNDIIFVHGGISYETLAQNLDIESINRKIREMINTDKLKPQDELEDFLTGPEGPLWFRGYIKLSDDYYKVTKEKYDFSEQKLDAILNYFKVSKIVFANTNVNEILPMYNNKLIGIDIPFSEKNIELQGLFYDGENFYKSHANGKRDLIK